LNNKLRAKDNSVDMLIRLGFTDEQIVDYLYLASLSRPPTYSERSELTAALAEAEGEKIPGVDDPRRAALIDMSWALLTGKEFMFNH
jgi:alkylhydroperoxidase family enzyme